MKLSLFDQAFFKLEEVGMAPLPMGGALILNPKSADWELSGEDIANHLAARMEKIPLMRKKPLQDKLKIGSIRLVDDPNFDVNNHISVTRVKRPGGYRQLAEHLGEFSQKPIPTDRPLWQFEIIEGLRGGKIAVATHIHHGILVGVGAVEALAGLNDLEPRRPDKPRTIPWPADDEPKAGQLISDALRESVDRSFVKTPQLVRKSVRPLLRAGALKAADKLANSDSVASQDEPSPSEVTVQKTSLNPDRLSTERLVAWKELDLARVKKISKRHGCTINDLALTLCSVALDHHYAARDETVDFDQVAVMPVNVRSEQDGTAGNAVSAQFVNLHNTQTDIAERLQAISGDTRILKHQARPKTKGPIDGKELMAVFSPFLLESALRLVTRFDLLSRVKIANTIVSNVPGARVPLYVAGAAVESVIPMAPLVDGMMALSCAISSTHSKLVIGFHGCAETIGDMGALVRGVEHGIKALS